MATVAVTDPELEAKAKKVADQIGIKPDPEVVQAAKEGKISTGDDFGKVGKDGHH